VRSIFVKVLIWSVGTIVLSYIAFFEISHQLDHRRGHEHPFSKAMSMVEDDICKDYEIGGSMLLAERLKRIDQYLPGEHLLLDRAGRDLVTGTDRAELLTQSHRGPGPPRAPDGRLVFISPKRGDGGKYRFISLVSPEFDFLPNIMPYYSLVVVVIVAMGAILAAHLAVPLRRLRRVVEQFGQGDRSARVGFKRKDEIGELAQAFDQMADRIETLLVAERRLLQDVSHELRSPLTRLDVAVDLAFTSDDPKVSLSKIKRDIGRLTVLVNELLELTRAEGDPATLNQESVALDDVVLHIAEECGLEAESRGCSLTLFGVIPAEIRGNRELIRRAIENVVRNAIRHSPEGATIELSLERKDDHALVVIRDYGQGVPDDLREAIFQPFFRIEGHRSRASGGVGLGLAIARRAIDLHNGRIFARNVEPGLSVSIELPMTPTSPALT
jgi:two-component system sensor histidine kinase CpxA